MNPYTFIGFWPDSMQRFATIIYADTPNEAEKECFDQHPGVAVCCVLLGRHLCVDQVKCVTSEAC